MNQLNPSKEIISIATEKYIEFNTDHKELEEGLDEWFQLDSDWDLNLGHYNNERYATLYPISNGVTDTLNWVEVV